LLLGLGSTTMAFGACSSDSSDAGDNPTGGQGASGATGTGTGSGGTSSSSSTTSSGATSSGSGGETDPGSGGDGNMGSGGAPDFRECASSDQQARLLPANLLFVIDRSGSMNCNPPEGDDTLNELCKTNPVKQDPGEPSKWEVTRDALSDALDALGAQENVSAGVSVFPKPDPVNGCLVAAAPDVEIARLDADHREAIDDFLTMVDPQGDTPIAGATILSYQYLSQQLVDGELEGNTFVVLLTDGAETCDVTPNPENNVDYLEQLIEMDVPNATLFNIRTFVIGAPGSEEGRGLLSQIAFEGLTPRDPDCDHSGAEPDEGDCHFDMTTTTDFAEELADALRTISQDRTLSCQYDIPTNTSGDGRVDLNKVNVTFTDGDGEEITVLRDDSEACDDGAEGWQYSEDRTKILLCGDICDAVQADDEGEVRIVLGCPSVPRIR
jgi:Mg-chelatase subunit ChlD